MEKSKVLLQFLLKFRQSGLSFSFFMPVGFAVILRQTCKSEFQGLTWMAQMAAQKFKERGLKKCCHGESGVAWKLVSKNQTQKNPFFHDFNETQSTESQPFFKHYPNFLIIFSKMLINMEKLIYFAVKWEILRWTFRKLRNGAGQMWFGC